MFEYLKDKALIQEIDKPGESLVFYSCFYFFWAVSANKARLIAYKGKDAENEELAVEETWEVLKKDLSKGFIKIGNERINFIALAPVLHIPKGYEKNLRFYKK